MQKIYDDMITKVQCYSHQIFILTIIARYRTHTIEVVSESCVMASSKYKVLSTCFFVKTTVIRYQNYQNCKSLWWLNQKNLKYNKHDNLKLTWNVLKQPHTYITLIT